MGVYATQMQAYVVTYTHARRV
eukprot:COSAG04_NODE_6287_length_1365_cov_1.251185_3_plen_21_part_01